MIGFGNTGTKTVPEINEKPGGGVVTAFNILPKLAKC
jgi:hypothetical protein